MKFYPIELMDKAIVELEDEIKQVQEQSNDEYYIRATEFVNEMKIIQLKSAISYLSNANNIPLVGK